MPRRSPVLAALALSLCVPHAIAASPLKSLTDRVDILSWEAVGRLDLDGRGFCSASLIAPAHVLTAAHCVFGENGERIDPVRLTFFAGLRDGDAIATRAVARAVVPQAYDPSASGSAESIRHDVALLELAEAIPATVADPFGLSHNAAKGRQVTVLSYGKGRSNAMSREMGCTIIAAHERLMAFDCQAVPGSSGAPIFDMSGRSPRVVSIVSGSGRYDGRRAVFGMELPAVVADLQRAFRTGDGVWPGREPTQRKVIGLSERAAGQARFLRP